MIFSSIDEKPKKARPLALKRVSNIIANPNVCFLVDRYAEDWRKLQYVMVVGSASVTREPKTIRAAVALLRKKYRQYSSMKLETLPLIKIKPLRVIAWKPLRASRTVKAKEYD